MSVSLPLWNRGLAYSWLILAPLVSTAAPVINTGGVLNAASYTANAAPGGAIAQGSIFAIFGAGLGPAAPAQVSKFPLGPQFAGVSIAVSQGTTQIAAIPIFVAASQINAILPSNTPLGTVSLTVTYNGQTSNAEPVQVAVSAPGVFTATGTGRGWGVFLHYLSAADQPVNSGKNAAA